MAIRICYVVSRDEAKMQLGNAIAFEKFMVQYIQERVKD